MTRALVFDTDACFLPEDVSPSALSASEKLAGLTLMRRALLMAWKAGAEDAIVIARDEESRRLWNASEARLPIRVRVISAQAPLSGIAGEEQVLVLSAHVLPRRGLLETLLETARREAGPVVAINRTTSYAGPAIVVGSELQTQMESGASVTEAVRTLLSSPGVARVNVDETASLRLNSSNALKQADREIYRGLTSVTDGYLARRFYRRLSRRFTRQVINLPVKPNHVTLLHFSLGMAAAGLMWPGIYWLGVVGAVLLQLSVVLDCADGEIARLKYQFSKFGSWFDIWADNIVNIAVFAAIAHAATARLGASLALTLGALAVAGVLMCILVVFTMAKLQDRIATEASALAVTNRLSSGEQVSSRNTGTRVDAIINEATSRDFLVLVVLFALLGRLEWFVWLAAIGSHVFWVTFGVIQLARLKPFGGVGR